MAWLAGSPARRGRPGDPASATACVTWAAQRLVVGTLAPRHGGLLHPVAFAAWLGLLVTTLNLVPAGQLDGGHVLYALLGRRRARSPRTRRHRPARSPGIFLSWSWLVWWSSPASWSASATRPRSRRSRSAPAGARRLVCRCAVLRAHVRAGACHVLTGRFRLDCRALPADFDGARDARLDSAAPMDRAPLAPSARRSPSPAPPEQAEPAAWDARASPAWEDEAAHRAYLARFPDLDGLAVAGRPLPRGAG